MVLKRKECVFNRRLRDEAGLIHARRMTETFSACSVPIHTFIQGDLMPDHTFVTCILCTQYKGS